MPHTPPVFDLCHLPTKTYHGTNPVKAVVDIVLGHADATISEVHIQNLVLEGDVASLPAIARPPMGAIPVNHFTQLAFLKRRDGT